MFEVLSLCPGKLAAKFRHEATQVIRDYMACNKEKLNADMDALNKVKDNPVLDACREKSEHLKALEQQQVKQKYLTHYHENMDSVKAKVELPKAMHFAHLNTFDPLWCDRVQINGRELKRKRGWDGKKTNVSWRSLMTTNELILATTAHQFHGVALEKGEKDLFKLTDEVAKKTRMCAGIWLEDSKPKTINSIGLKIL